MRRRLSADRVDLRERAERALTRNRDLEPALHRPLDFSFHRKTAVECILELPQRRRPSRQLPREGQPSHRGHHHRLNAVADRDLESAVGILQLRDLDRGFTLAADVDERHLRSDRDDGSLDGLPLLETLRFERRFEHRGEIFLFLWLGHGTLLYPAWSNHSF